MRFELRRRLAILTRILPTFGLVDDAHAIKRHVELGDIEPWLLGDYGHDTLESIGGGLEVAEHLTTPRTERSNDVRLAREALEEIHTLLDEEIQISRRAACVRAA